MLAKPRAVGTGLPNKNNIISRDRDVTMAEWRVRGHVVWETLRLQK